MRSYQVVDGHTSSVYQGFNRDFSTPHRLLITESEGGEMEVWALDPEFLKLAIDQFLSYTKKYRPWEKLIGTYSEEGFRGFTIPLNNVSELSRF